MPQQNDQALDSAHGRELMGRFHTVGILAVAAVVALGCLIGLLFFLRPAVSQFENRTLTPFPKLSASSFFDGSFFTDVSLWYSDTYPLREPLVKADQAFESLYGIEPEVQVVGSGRVADELPVVPDEADVEAQDGAEQQEAPQDPLVDDPLLDEQIIVPDERVIAAEVQAALMDGLYVDGDAAYSIYYFAQEAVQRYARALNLAATNLAGHARVFSIIVPNSSGIMLSQEVQDSLGGSDQREAIKYFYSLYEDGVTDVFIFDLLREHNDEYVYYRTDHHWTMRGAYYGYLAFCEKAGIDAVTLDERAYLDNGSFLGSYYNELGLASMDANPDTLDTWIPNGTNEMTFMDTDGQWYDGEVVQDVHDWDPLYKSNYLVNGDPPLARIDNPALPEGQTLLVVMDSFGCSLTPLLVDNYKCVWIIDPRYYDGNIVSFALENEVDDVLFVNSMSLAGTDPISMALLSKVQAEQPADQTQTQLATTEQTDVQEP